MIKLSDGDDVVNPQTVSTGNKSRNLSTESMKLLLKYKPGEYRLAP